MSTNKQNSPLQILLADDDSDDRLFFAKALLELPIATTLATVHDGERLMNYLSENTRQIPDVIFLDLNMPRKNGIECLSELKSNEKFKDIPVIIFSTSFPSDKSYESNLIDTLLKIGAQDYIRKLNDFNQLKLSILEAIESVQRKM